MSFMQLIEEQNLPEQERVSILNKIDLIQVKKGTVLQEIGESPKKMWFVKSGLLRSYSIDEKGKEHNFLFAPENWIMSDMYAYSFNTEAKLVIEAMEESELEEVLIQPFDQEYVGIFGSSQKLQWDENRKMMKRASVLQKRIIQLMSATAQERYEDFIKTYPNIVQRIPQKHIASYCGITPEALSKIRKEMLGK